MLSCDKGGMLEVWTGPKGDYKFPKNLQWEYKTDTDLYEFVKVRIKLQVKIKVMMITYKAYFSFCSKGYS